MWQMCLKNYFDIIIVDTKKCYRRLLELLILSVRVGEEGYFSGEKTKKKKIISVVNLRERLSYYSISRI